MLAFLLLGTPLALLLLPVPRLPPLYSLITAITQPGLALTSCLPASTFQVLGLWTHAIVSSPSWFHPRHWLRLPSFPLVTSHHPSPATSPGQSRETDMSTCAFSVKVSADPSPSFQSLWVTGCAFYAVGCLVSEKIEFYPLILEIFFPLSSSELEEVVGGAE